MKLIYKSKSKIFIGIAVSFALGIFLASAFAVPKGPVYVLLALFITVFAFSFIGKFYFGAIAALFLFCAGLGLLWLWQSVRPNEYENLFESKQQIEGEIVEDIDVRPDKQLLTLLPKGESQRILLTVPLTQEFFYGDLIVAEGKIAAAKNFDAFDYQKYLERYDIYAVMSYPKVLILKNHAGSFIKESLLKVKWAFSKKIDRLFAAPENSLLLGILIGARKTLPADLTDDFNRTGLSHVVAVSGYNISIIIGALGFLAWLIGRRGSFWLSLMVIAGFTVMAGASASVIRAAVMGGLLLLSSQAGRLYKITPAVCAAALVMLIINPRILFWDIGFQLSFLATLGIIYGVPVLEKLTHKIPSDFGIKGVVLVTASATLATLPLILFNFGRLSLVSLLANILVLPLVPYIMLFGFFSALPWLGAGFAYLTHWLLVYILFVIQKFSALPFASLQVKVSSWAFILLCLLIIGFYWFLKTLADKSRHLPTGHKLPRKTI